MSSSTYGQRALNSHFSAIIMVPTIIYTLLLTLPSTLANAYALNPNMISMAPAQYQQRQPTSALASKVLFHSPSIANMYKEMIVQSKPLHLRKHGNGPKAKKTKKDSKIYYIPIPPMPYRYIPGVGLDYQPMKIKPILQQVPHAPLAPGSMAGLNQIAHVSGGGMANPNKVLMNQLNTSMGSGNLAAQGGANKNEVNVMANVKPLPLGLGGAGESKMHRMHRGEYYFNGRPFRLQVAHAHPKNQLTPLNLKSKLYFNKNIIY